MSARETITALADKLTRVEAERDELRKQLAQQAAVIEQVREAFRTLKSCTAIEGAYGRAVQKTIADALALQPCPEVLNKVRAEAINKEASALWHAAMEKCKKDRVNPAERNDLFFGISQLRESAQRIEQGEA